MTTCTQKRAPDYLTVLSAFRRAYLLLVCFVVAILYSVISVLLLLLSFSWIIIILVTTIW